MMKYVFRFNFYGLDQKGITAEINSVLKNYQVEILDIGQSLIHEFLFIGFLLHFSKLKESRSAIKTLSKLSEKHQLQFSYKDIKTETLVSWNKKGDNNRYIMTLISKEKMQPDYLEKITRQITNHGMNIVSIDKLSRWKSHQAKMIACYEFILSGNLTDKQKLTQEFLKISHESPVDIALQKDNLFRRTRRLVVFDMDSTLIQTEVIDELAKLMKVEKKVKKITELAMNGKIDFDESLKKRVFLLKGLEEKKLKLVAENLPITEGLPNLMKVLKKLGYKTAILSGGFDYFGNYLQDKFGFDYVVANKLEVIDGKLTGHYLGSIVNGKSKGDNLIRIAKDLHIDLEQTIAVGDGANDLEMLNLAGLGIAFHAKPLVKSKAQNSISHLGLDAILYFLGYREELLS